MPFPFLFEDFACFFLFNVLGALQHSLFHHGGRNDLVLPFGTQHQKSVAGVHKLRLLICSLGLLNGGHPAVFCQILASAGVKGFVRQVGLQFLIPAFVGNVIGGTLLFSLLAYGQVQEKV